ncbi:hypothetical protein ADUPG1_006173 [Aduncisulcus paluster]|uniref:Uncharacterized protein n=1 Tax=Aduncisulcus paluster TaxID=2918883 RepID=A0ABQ5KH27_9EUKA|nr:hypothetical protein ADUPG1_006173 [Aduncisulcus paluster]
MEPAKEEKSDSSELSSQSLHDEPHLEKLDYVSSSASTQMIQSDEAEKEGDSFQDRDPGSAISLCSEESPQSRR